MKKKISSIIVTSDSRLKLIALKWATEREGRKKNFAKFPKKL